MLMDHRSLVLDSVQADYEPNKVREKVWNRRRIDVFMQENY